MSKKKEQVLAQPPRWARNAALARYMNISAMSLWRWQRDEAIGFPQPTLIGKTFFTDLNVVDAWMRDRVVTRISKSMAR